MPKALLLQRPSGVYARFLLPADIRRVLGRRFLIRSLRDFRHDAARLIAARIGYALAQLIREHRAGILPMSKKLVDDVLKAHARGEIQKAYEVTQLPGGSYSVKADTAEDHTHALQTINALRSMAPITPGAVAPAGPMLHASIDRFLKQFQQKGLAEATNGETLHTLKLFRDLVDDRPINRLGHHQLDAFRDDLAHWPKGARNQGRFKDVTAREIVNAGRADNDGERLSVRTIEKHLDRLRVFFNDLVQRDEITRNPLSGIRLQTTTAKYEASFRGFKARELLKIFDPHLRAQYADGTPMFYWLPLMALMTGARQNELADLWEEEITQEEGVWGIHIVPHPRRKLKNRQSKRFVPLPDRLLDFGFLDYARQIKSMGYKELFPGGSLKSKNGPGDTISKHFNRTYLPAINGKDDDVCFHSFRHTFASKADTLHLTETQIGRVTGHAPRSILSKHYIDPKTITERKETVDAVADAFELPAIRQFDRRQFVSFFLELDRKRLAAAARAARATHQTELKARKKRAASRG